ncbi:hypothetical protein M8C21_012327, partial [Ambrosia artemisiifolia]
MKRQQSILSFLHKRPPPEPEPEKPVPEQKLKPKILTGSNRSSINSSGVEILLLDDIKGTETPPEKEQRPFFPLTSVDRTGESVFSSIKHKFMKRNSVETQKTRDDRNSSDDRTDYVNLTSNKYSYSSGRDMMSSIPVFPRMESVMDVEETVCIGNKGHPLVIENDGDIIGPETPGTKPLASHSCNLGSNATATTNFLMGSSKRVKFSDNLPVENKKDDLASEMASKFDWLHPSKIRDANGRRPDNPLYDKRTLYIPPDVFKKMSASQKQYWSVKSQYMDVLIFFKVGKFYELYELDAEIGHKELDWKITMSGVGKCRQVGITEHAIDDAIEKLLARMYKVGRVEQLETADQAKSRGNSSVIQRKLVQVLTPSTLIHGNIGPQAVHLLSLKEGTSDPADGTTAYGFAFVDCASLQFWIGSVSPAEIIYESQGLSKETQKALNKYSMMGSAVSQLTPAQPFSDFVDSSEVLNVFQLKGYFKGSSNVWDRALDEVVHQDIALYALGGLASHLS